MHDWSFSLFSRTETIPTAEPEINMEIGSINYPTLQFQLNRVFSKQQE